MTATTANRARLAWRMRLHSALRTALACIIIGCAKIYGPEPFASHIKFTAFSYLISVIIVSDATLGDTISGCWHVFCATTQVVPLAMLGRWGVARFRDDGTVGIAVASMAVGVLAFIVALQSMHLTAKKIAFGQIVLVCTDAVISENASIIGFMHPVYVAASTVLGAVASIMALLLPYPDLASSKIRKLCHAYSDNASQRMNLYLRAFVSRDSRGKKELVSQAKPLEESGAKLLHGIRILQEGLQWERLWCRYSKHSLVDQLEAMELQLRGMGYSLDSSSDCLAQPVDHDTLSNVLQEVSTQIQQKISQFMTEAEHKKPSLPLQNMLPIAGKHGWVCFFLSCIDMMLSDVTDSYAHARELQTQTKKAESNIFTSCKAWIMKITRKERLEFALKCSLSLGLAVLFGLIFDKHNGCWAGLTIAISFVTGKQAIFTVANTRAQGTAIGSVYGVICCFLFHYEVLKLLALLPWLFFSSMLKYSKMYGQSGGISAAIGALLILGRKNYGAPNEFALARVTEVFIGLSTFLAVELCLQPIRAAELAKNHLQTTLSSLIDCIKETRNCLAQRHHVVPKLVELRNKHRNLNSLVCELMKSVSEAELEPDLWYVSFRASSYQKLVQSLSKIADILCFIIRDFEILRELSESTTVIREFSQQMYDELESSQTIISSSLEYLKKAHSDFPEDRHCLTDLELGKVNRPVNHNNYLIHEQTITDKSIKEKSEDSTGLHCLRAAEFCFSALMKEIEKTTIRIREIN